MKKSNVVLLIIVLFLLFAVMYLINKSRPADFNWKETYDTHDRQPFGCFVFDRMLEKSWKEGYKVLPDRFSDLYDDEDTTENNFLIVCNNMTTTQRECNLLLDFISNGGKVLIAAKDFDNKLADTLKFDLYPDFSLPFSNLSKPHASSSVVFHTSTGDDSIKGVPLMLVEESYFSFPSKETPTESDSAQTESKKKNKSPYGDFYAVVSNAEDKPVMIHFKIGKGDLILSCTPVLFTNYATLSDSINPFIRNSLSILKGKPLIRTEYYEKGTNQKQNNSLFRYLLSQPALRWAFFITLFTILLFMFFTARRKQRPIPIVKPPSNKMLDFVRSIASLYIYRNNNADIVLKKQTYWAEEIKRDHAIDIINEPHDDAFISRFSAKIGISEKEARSLFRALKAINENTAVSDGEMLELINKMNINNGRIRKQDRPDPFFGQNRGAEE